MSSVGLFTLLRYFGESLDGGCFTGAVVSDPRNGGCFTRSEPGRPSVDSSGGETSAARRWRDLGCGEFFVQRAWLGRRRLALTCRCATPPDGGAIYKLGAAFASAVLLCCDPAAATLVSDRKRLHTIRIFT
ncbi:unnamed protein product [Cuscuta campestris]|uniref:Uncharacterized protein n=1 Tax=Cuscuta campestris TaxID=132261 RepID=A0A484M503_9ASTE|nr:unnamed protein product [Cuscuta campestris]